MPDERLKRSFKFKCVSKQEFGYERFPSSVRKTLTDSSNNLFLLNAIAQNFLSAIYHRRVILYKLIIKIKLEFSFLLLIIDSIFTIDSISIIHCIFTHYIWLKKIDNGFLKQSFIFTCVTKQEFGNERFWNKQKF